MTSTIQAPTDEQQSLLDQVANAIANITTAWKLRDPDAVEIALRQLKAITETDEFKDFNEEAWKAIQKLKEQDTVTLSANDPSKLVVRLWD